jgi:catechol 2,3-dioxygenase-like lactoylglutathione lyase family enzyme
MIQSIAFLAYAVSDIKAARHFYEDILGLKLTHEAGGEWFEYDVGDTTFAISAADAEHPAPFRRGITETTVCRFAIVLDPDGSEVIIHKRKMSA